MRGYKGYVLADAAPVYHALYAAEAVTEVACWAHARRYFFYALSTDKERAEIGLRLVAELYQADAATKDLPPARRTEARRARAVPIIAAMRAWLDNEALVVLPKSPIGEAVAYARAHWEPLMRISRAREHQDRRHVNARIGAT